MDEAKQMTVEEALAAADRMLDPDDGGVEEFMECGLDVVDTLVAEVRRLTAARATARREGAEAMRERAKSALREWVIAGRRGKHASTDTLEAVNMIAVLPLDAHGGAT